MNSGTINELLLEKNIEKLKYYSNEEKKLLNKINNIINETNDYYHSTNTTLLMKLNNLKSDINHIYNKRIKYTTILNEVILNYQDLSVDTVNIFNNL